MIHKKFKSGSRSSSRSGSNAVNYLLGADRQREDAKLLQGDVDNTLSIIEQNPHKTTYVSGCLSFTETDLSDKQKAEIIASFEDTIFHGMDKDQYNTLWVEHRDKINPETGEKRLELNYLIPTVELDTNKYLNPTHFDESKGLVLNRNLIKEWQEKTNHEYGLTSPDEIDRKRDYRLDKKQDSKGYDIREEISRNIAEKVSNGELKTRDDVLNELQKNGYEIARDTKSSISIKNPSSENENARNLRLSGEVFKRDFDPIKVSNEYKEYLKSQEADRAEAKYKNHCENYNALLERKAEENNKKYPNKERRELNKFHRLHEAQNRAVEAEKNAAQGQDKEQQEKAQEEANKATQAIRTVYTAKQVESYLKKYPTYSIYQKIDKAKDPQEAVNKLYPDDKDKADKVFKDYQQSREYNANLELYKYNKIELTEAQRELYEQKKGQEKAERRIDFMKEKLEENSQRKSELQAQVQATQARESKYFGIGAFFVSRKDKELKQENVKQIEQLDKQIERQEAQIERESELVKQGYTIDDIKQVNQLEKELKEHTKPERDLEYTKQQYWKAYENHLTAQDKANRESYRVERNKAYDPHKYDKLNELRRESNQSLGLSKYFDKKAEDLEKQTKEPEYLERKAEIEAQISQFHQTVQNRAVENQLKADKVEQLKAEQQELVKANQDIVKERQAQATPEPKPTPEPSQEQTSRDLFKAKLQEMREPKPEPKPEPKLQHKPESMAKTALAQEAHAKYGEGHYFSNPENCEHYNRLNHVQESLQRKTAAHEQYMQSEGVQQLEQRTAQYERDKPLNDKYLSTQHKINKEIEKTERQMDEKKEAINATDKNINEGRQALQSFNDKGFIYKMRNKEEKESLEQGLSRDEQIKEKYEREFIELENQAKSLQSQAEGLPQAFEAKYGESIQDVRSRVQQYELNDKKQAQELHEEKLDYQENKKTLDRVDGEINLIDRTHGINDDDKSFIQEQRQKGNLEQSSDYVQSVREHEQSINEQKAHAQEQDRGMSI